MGTWARFPSWCVACGAGSLGLLQLAGCAEGTQLPPLQSPPDTTDSDATTETNAPSLDSTLPGADAAGIDAAPAPPACDPASVTFEPPLPTPRLSTGRPVAASAGVEGPGRLVDDTYGQASRTRFGTLENGPEWVSVDLGSGHGSVLVTLQADGASYHQENSGAPLAYALLASSDTTDGSDGQWQKLVAVDDNDVVRSRSHVVDLGGSTWLRLEVRAARPDVTAVLEELSVFDLASVDDERYDSWLVLGDSITQMSFTRTGTSAAYFDGLVHADDERLTPAFTPAGIGGEFVTDGLARLDEALEANPGMRQFGVAFGTNDAWGNKSPAAFEAGLRELVERLLDAGKVPMLARVPFATSGEHDTLPAFNAVIDSVQAEFGLPCGPDLYAYFQQNPDDLTSDGVHPDSGGQAAINRLWAEAALAFQARQ